MKRSFVIGLGLIVGTAIWLAFGSVNLIVIVTTTAGIALVLPTVAKRLRGIED